MKRQSRTDWNRVDAMSDENIDYSDIPEMDEEFFHNAELSFPRKKVSLSLRLDPEVLAWFKAQGKGYQTRMTAVLKAYMMNARRDGGENRSFREGRTGNSEKVAR